jgi:hypothetical protein
MYEPRNTAVALTNLTMFPVTAVVLEIHYFTPWRLSPSRDPPASLAVLKSILMKPTGDPHGSQRVKYKITDVTFCTEFLQKENSRPVCTCQTPVNIFKALPSNWLRNADSFGWHQVTLRCEQSPCRRRNTGIQVWRISSAVLWQIWSAVQSVPDFELPTYEHPHLRTGGRRALTRTCEQLFTLRTWVSSTEQTTYERKFGTQPVRKLGTPVFVLKYLEKLRIDISST